MKTAFLIAALALLAFNVSTMVRQNFQDARIAELERKFREKHDIYSYGRDKIRMPEYAKADLAKMIPSVRGLLVRCRDCANLQNADRICVSTSTEKNGWMGIDRESCALALPPMMTGTHGIPIYPRHVEVYKLLQWFAHAGGFEFDHIFRERILVIGDDRSTNGLVQFMRRGGLQAWGIEERYTRRRHYVRGSFMMMPFASEVFHVVCGFDFLIRFSDIMFPSLQTRNVIWGGIINEVWRTLDWGGFFIVGLTEERGFSKLLEQKGFFRLPFKMDGLSIFQKFKTSKVLTFAKGAA